MEKERVTDLLETMKSDQLSTDKNVETLKKELSDFYSETQFLACTNMGEIMELDLEDPLSPGFPVYELTSSGLTNAGGGRTGEVNRHRVNETNFQKLNFGMLQIDWKKGSVSLELRDINGKTVASHRAALVTPAP